MKYKFNPFERTVGIFLFVAIFGSLSIGVGIAVKKNWFEERDSYVTFTHSAGNIRVGGAVLMAGLKVGRIDEVDIDDGQRVRVSFSVYRKYGKNLREGATAQFVRPFVIGDKVLTLTPGAPTMAAMAPGSTIPLRDATDLLELLSGKNVEIMMAKFDSILTNVDEALVLGKDLAAQVGDKKKLQATMENLAFATREIRKILPHITQRTPAMTQDLEKALGNMVAISQGLREMQPAIQAAAGKLPEGSERTLVLLNESVTLLQAMQKSIFIRGSVQEVREEKLAAEKAQAKMRAPAAD